MIQPNELRIGNWVIVIGREDYPCMKISAGTQIDHSIHFQPIPLTHEILEKAGFSFVEYSDDSDSVADFILNSMYEYKESFSSFDYYIGVTHIKGEHLIQQEQLYFEFLMASPATDGEPVVICRPTYVHELQNIFYAITGKELQIEF